MASPDPLVQLIDEVFSAHGFVRRKKSWYLKGAEATVFVELQPSQWQHGYYLNLAAEIRELGYHEWPKDLDAHIRTRLGALAGTDIDSLLDKGHAVDDTSGDKSHLRTLLEDVAIPALLTWMTISGVREALQQGGLRNALVDKRVKELVARR